MKSLHTEYHNFATHVKTKFKVLKKNYFLANFRLHHFKILVYRKLAQIRKPMQIRKPFVQKLNLNKFLK